MKEQDKQQTFEYVYVAPSEYEKKVIKNISDKYQEKTKKTPSAFERLKELDQKVNGKATAVSIALGVLGALIFGLGLSMILEWRLILWGILVCAVGVFPLAFAYPAYNKVFNNGKKKYGEEILKLTQLLVNPQKTSQEQTEE